MHTRQKQLSSQQNRWLLIQISYNNSFCVFLHDQQYQKPTIAIKFIFHYINIYIINLFLNIFLYFLHIRSNLLQKPTIIASLT